METHEEIFKALLDGYVLTRNDGMKIRLLWRNIHELIGSEWRRNDFDFSMPEVWGIDASHGKYTDRDAIIITAEASGNRVLRGEDKGTRKTKRPAEGTKRKIKVQDRTT